MTSSGGGVWIIEPCVGAKYEIVGVKLGDLWVVVLRRRENNTFLMTSDIAMRERIIID